LFAFEDFLTYLIVFLPYIKGFSKQKFDIPRFCNIISH